MRFLHTSDWHIGRDFYGYDLAEYQDFMLEQLLDQLRDLRPDALLIAGDVLDKPHSSDQDMRRVSDFITAARHYTRIILISGNHDGASRIGFIDSLLADGVDIITRASQVGRAVEIPDDQGNLGALVYPVPYIYPYQDRAELSSWTDKAGQVHLDDYLLQSDSASKQPLSQHPLESAENLDTTKQILPGNPQVLLGAVLRRIARDLQQRRREGTQVPSLGMIHDYFVPLSQASSQENEATNYVGSLPALPVDALATLGGVVAPGEGLDYLALGHVHRSYSVHSHRPVAKYCGSLLPYRTSDRNQAQSLLVCIDSRHQVEVSPQPLKLPYRVAQLHASMRELAHPDRFKQYRDCFVSLRLDETVMKPQDYQIVRALFPRLVNLSYASSDYSHSQTRVDLSPQRSPLEVAQDFLKTKDASEAELQLLKEIYSELRDSPGDQS